MTSFQKITIQTLCKVDELKPIEKPKPKRPFKRRNMNVTSEETTASEIVSEALPQPKDAMVSSSLLNKFLEADKLDENV